MSKRNTLAAKADRSDSRDFRGCNSRVARTPLTDIPTEARTSLLSNPKEKLTRSVREQLIAAGGKRIEISTTPKTELAVKNLRRALKLPLQQLLREQQRTARRASTLKYVAIKATLGSKIRAVYETAQTAQLAYLKQLSAEIYVRTGVGHA